MKLTYAILFALASIAVGGDGTHYSDAFYSHYPVRGRVFDLMGYALEVPTVAHNNNGQRVATVRRTRGDKYPYEDQKCEITVEGDGLETPRVLSAAHFRTVEVSSITDKLLFLRLGIGNVAAVEAIYDTEKDIWIFRESVQYEKTVESGS
jgi:hypothetical protein